MAEDHSIEQRITDLENDFYPAIRQTARTLERNEAILHDIDVQQAITNARLGTIDTRLNTLDVRMNYTGEQLAAIKGDVARLSSDMQEVKGDLRTMREDITQIVLLLTQRAKEQ